MVLPVRKILNTGLTLSTLALVASLASAQIYKTTDGDGNVVFTDTPPAGNSTEQVELQRTNSAPPPAAMPKAESSPRQDEPAQPGVIVAITSPTPETTIPMGPGNFSVTARVEPPLAKGQSMQLSIDGEPHGGPQPSGFWDLTNIFRGAHDLVVQVINQDGDTISSSEPVRVYVMRPSIN